MENKATGESKLNFRLYGLHIVSLKTYDIHVETTIGVIKKHQVI